LGIKLFSHLHLFLKGGINKHCWTMTMPEQKHHYSITVKWTGNTGHGTEDYNTYSRDHIIEGLDKPSIPASSDPKFRGDKTRWNPEELLLASISTCHKLWFLHLCSVNNISVQSYEDAAQGVMMEENDGSGRFISATLHPKIRLRHGDDSSKAAELHHLAHQKCFIANSLNFPVEVKPTFL
jgi:organic hydroperoxide reductase OsmC/OhrA